MSQSAERGASSQAVTGKSDKKGKRKVDIAVVETNGSVDEENATDVGELPSFSKMDEGELNEIDDEPAIDSERPFDGQSSHSICFQS